MCKNEFWRLQKAADLSNKECASLLGVTVRSIEKWRVSKPEAPKAAILVLKSVSENKPVSFLDMTNEEKKHEFLRDCGEA